jgi:hypothetical protein
MQEGRKHLFHMVSPSARPLLIGFGAFFLTTGLIFYINKAACIFFPGEVFLMGFFLLLHTTIE